MKIANRKEQGIAGYSVIRLRDMLLKKEVSILELVDTYLSRIQTYDNGKDGLNSVAEIDEDVREFAKQLQDNWEKEKEKPLFGIPILVKDNIETNGNLHTTAGSLSLAQLQTKKDAKIISYLKNNGAIILGKTNLTEFANYTTLNMPGGYSSRGGKVKSAFGAHVDPSGSSTGSAVAVSAGFCAAAIGSDTCNSIIGPSLYADMVGYRPSIGKLSRDGMIPISFTLDTAGPMTRTVLDAALVYDSMRSGFNNNAENESIMSVLLKSSKEESLKGLHFAINTWDNETLSSEEVKQWQAATEILKDNGAKLTEIKVPTITFIRTIMKYEFKYAMNEYLGTLSSSFPIKNLKDIIEYNNAHPKETLKYGQVHLLDAQEKTTGKLDEDEYIKAMKDREELKRRLKDQWKTFHAVIFRTSNVPHCAGYPIVAVPFTKEHYMNPDQPTKTPFGMCITGLDDISVMQIAHRIERVFRY